MKANKKIWNAEPWDESITTTLPRPSEKVRNNIYALAKEQADANASRVKIKSFTKHLRVRAPFFLWSTAAAILITVCVWLGNTDNTLSKNNVYTQKDVKDLTEDIVSVIDVEKIYPITETNGTDSDDIFLIVELQTINEGLGDIENNLQSNL